LDGRRSSADLNFPFADDMAGVQAGTPEVAKIVADISLDEPAASAVRIDAYTVR